MKINVLVSVDNFITYKGLLAIISNEMKSSKISFIDKPSLIYTNHLASYDVVLIEVNKNNKNDYNIVNDVITNFNITNLCLYSSYTLDRKILNLAQIYNFNVIYAHQSQQVIAAHIFSHNSKFKRTRKEKKLNEKSNDVKNVVSEKECKIGLIQINSDITTSISQESGISSTL